VIFFNQSHVKGFFQRVVLGGRNTDAVTSAVHWAESKAEIKPLAFDARYLLRFPAGQPGHSARQSPHARLGHQLAGLFCHKEKMVDDMLRLAAEL
jgi:hypothetical protein